MKRLTTNYPDNNLDAALNLFYIKDFETWVRGGGDGTDYPDIRLYDFIRKAAKILLPDLDFPMDDDGVDYAMGELLLDGPDEPTGLLALLYTAAWSYAELRGRLMQYEDTGLTPERCAEFARADAEGRYIVMRDAEREGVARLRELAEADKDGRVVVLPCKVGQRVFALLDTDKHISECEVKQIGMGNKIGFIGLEPIGARGREYGVALNGFGKTVFLTREEAEAALEAMKDE
jgi:hypothetical protein|nr:MAG TPA: hypothetical protein [Caudoviricetes sp.]